MTVTYKSPIGALFLQFEGEYLIGLTFENDTVGNREGESAAPQPVADAAVKQCLQELDEYFNGARQIFTVKTKLYGTPFRQSVWRALCNIPFGQTCSYKDIAVMVGKPKAVRAVGGANHRNPISIIVPCHRVIGANGQLVGYGGELWRKEWLLNHEK